MEGIVLKSMITNYRRVQTEKGCDSEIIEMYSSKGYMHELFISICVDDFGLFNRSVSQVNVEK